jgi:hypothetical protein
MLARCKSGATVRHNKACTMHEQTELLVKRLAYIRQPSGVRLGGKYEAGCDVE